MKRKLIISVLFVFILTMLFTACGDKTISNLEIVEGMKYEYQLNEAPDFSALKVQVKYNDGSFKVLGASDLEISGLDTATAGKQSVTVKYQDFSITVNVTVLGSGIVSTTKTLSSIAYLNGLNTSIFVGDTFSTDALNVTATYSDGSIATIGADKLTVGSIDTATPGNKTLTVSYTEDNVTKTCEIGIEVKEVKATKIEVDADSIDTVVVAGGTLDISTMEVTAFFNNGTSKLLSAEEYTTNLDDIDFDAEGNKDFVITYKNDTSITATLIITTEPPTLDRIVINEGSYVANVLLGDSYTTDTVTATAVYSNNTTKQIPNEKLTVTVDVSAAGAATLTAVHVDDETLTATATVNVLTIQSMTIGASSIPASIHLGNTLPETVQVIVVGSDGVTTFTYDGATVNLTSFDNTFVGNTSVTATFRGFESSPCTIAVTDPATYAITGVHAPASITALENKRNTFKNSTNPYIVGDDNPFIYKLTLTVYNEDGSKNESITDYIGVSRIFVDGALIPKAEVADYVTIDEIKHTYDFTEKAIGHTVIIETRPLNGVADYEAENTRTFEFNVVDGYNIYEAYELNLLTNKDDFDFHNEDSSRFTEDDTQTAIVNRFLGNKGVTVPASIASIILHGDLTITTEDIPSEYFIDGDPAKGIFDYLAVYAHANTAEVPNFTIHGNYYTIFSYGVPNVCAKGVGNQDEGLSNSQLFRLTISEELRIKNFDYTKYNTTVQNLYVRDDNPNADDVENAARAMLGVIGMKVSYQVTNIDNCNIEAFYISLLAEYDYLTVNINQSKFFNAWQNHIFLWANNQLADSDDETPAEDHKSITLNVTSSSITKCGGPVIISQTLDPALNYCSKSFSTVNFIGETLNRPFREGDDPAANEIWTFVTGQEAWFVSMGATDAATGILALDEFVKQVTYMASNGTVSKSYVYDNAPNMQGIKVMNLIMINLTAGVDVQEILFGKDDLDAKFTANGTTYLDMTDVYTGKVDGITVGYGNKDVADTYVSRGGKAQVLATANGYAAYDGTQNPPAGGDYLMTGDFITIYQGNMGIVLGYNIDFE